MRKELLKNLIVSLFALFLFMPQAGCNNGTGSKTPTIKNTVQNKLMQEETEQKMIDEDIKLYRPHVPEMIEKTKKKMADETLCPIGQDDYTIDDLGKARDSRAVPVLIDILKNYRTTKADSVDARVGAAKALGWIGDKSAIPVLKDAMNEESDAIRRFASLALLSFGEPDYARRFIKAEFKRGNYELFVMDELYKKTKIASDLDLDVLTEASKKGDDYTRLDAARTLSNLGEIEIEFYTYKDLFDKNSRYKEEAVWGLASIDDNRVKEVITRALNDKDEKVRNVAIEALEYNSKKGGKVALIILEEAAEKSNNNFVKEKAMQILQSLKKVK